MPRPSRSARKNTNYSVDVYRDLAASGSEAEIAPVPSDSDNFTAAEVSPPSESDDLPPSAVESDGTIDDDEPMEDASDVSDSTVGSPQKRKPKTGAKAKIEPNGEHSTRRVKKKRESNEYGDEEPENLAGDPNVRLLYRPGNGKRAGKLDRLTQLYGKDTRDISLAADIRNRSITQPAVPHLKTMIKTPFYIENQDNLNIAAILGKGLQDSRIVAYGPDIEHYLPVDKPLSVFVGPDTDNDRTLIHFQRFGVQEVLEGNNKAGHWIAAGGHVLGMDWAANRPDGIQYLALSVRESIPTYGMNSTDAPSAFDPQPGPAVIQIWRFPPGENGAPSEHPTLATVILHDWGYVKELKWCPMMYNLENSQDLGYLAGAFADGKARVLRVQLPFDDNQDSEHAKGCTFAKVDRAAFEVALPDELITTICWVTNHELAAGGANGSIAAWDLLCLDTDHELIPYVHLPLHHSYVTKIVSCYPSFPHTVSTASMDGYIRLTSLLAPFSEAVSFTRSRVAVLCLTWNDQLQSICASEEGQWAKLLPYRRFFSASITTKHGGITMDIASSFYHPQILTGGSEGEVIISNPARRMFHGKLKNFQQTWFKMLYSKKSNIWKCVEGFKLEEFESKGKPGNTNGPLVQATVWPPEQAVSKVAWNQNMRFAGWATAALECGLVRVQDVALGVSKPPMF